MQKNRKNLSYHVSNFLFLQKNTEASLLFYFFMFVKK